MRKIDLFEVGESGEASDACEAVGLDGNDAKIGEAVQVLHLSDLVLSQPELFQRRQGFEIFNFLCQVSPSLHSLQVWEDTHSNPICAQLQIPQDGQSF